MKALILKEYGRFVYEDVPDPQPGEGDVLIAVKACGICGSDVHGMDGSTGRRRPPVIMGHEAAGTIALLGKGVHGWEVGERVTFDSTVFCGSCSFCRQGYVNLCEKRRVLGVSCQEYRQNGAFAEYLTVPSHILYRLPERTSFSQAAMVEVLAIAVHAVERAPRRLGATAAVLGAGMIGLLVIQVLRAAGYRRVIALDVAPEKLELARRLGADEAVLVSEADPGPEISRLVSGGVDTAFDVVGMAGTVRTAVGLARKGGSVVLVGNLHPAVEFPLQSAVTRQITLYGSCASAGEYPVALDLIAEGKVNVDVLISAVAPLAEGAGWFDRLYRRDPGLFKVVLCP